MLQIPRRIYFYILLITLFFSLAVAMSKNPKLSQKSLRL